MSVGSFIGTLLARATQIKQTLKVIGGKTAVNSEPTSYHPATQLPLSQSSTARQLQASHPANHPARKAT